MTDWSTQPGLTQLWADFVAAIMDRDAANAKMDYTGQTNIPVGTIRWNTTSQRFESWSGTAWSVLSNVAQTANVVPNSRTVTAGAGLSGGGALSANITVSMANMAQSTVKGRAAAAGTGAPTDLTAAQLVAIITAADGAGSGLDADNLDGRTWSESATASTLVSRNSSGNVYATYFNQSGNVAENPPIGQVMVTNNTDQAYLRKASLAYFELQLGTEASTVSRVTRRDGSGDINVRLVRSEFGVDDTSTVASVGFRVNNSTDNYMRHCSLTRFKRQLFLNCTIATDPGTTPSGTAGDVWFYY